MTEKIRGVLMRPNEAPRRIEVENALAPLQALIGGYLEECPIAPGIVALVDEDGFRKKLARLGRVAQYEIVGPALIVGKRGTEWCSLDEASMRRFRWGREEDPSEPWSVKFFGRPDGGPVDAADVPTPVGCLCAFCEEAIAAEDPGMWVVHRGSAEDPAMCAHMPYHRECFGYQLLGPAPDERPEDPRRTRAKRSATYWSRNRQTWY